MFGYNNHEINKINCRITQKLSVLNIELHIKLEPASIISIAFNFLKIYMRFLIVFFFLNKAEHK